VNGVFGRPAIDEEAQWSNWTQPLHQNKTIFGSGRTTLLLENLIAKNREQNQTQYHADAQTEIGQPSSARTEAVYILEDGRESGEEQENETEEDTSVERNE